MVRIAPVKEVMSSGSGVLTGVMDRLKEDEALFGKASRMQTDFSDVWKKRVAKARSPLEEE
ncbi:MAG: hypothetical protein WCJ66_11635 [Verrucomicrobiota bacterium]